MSQVQKTEAVINGMDGMTRFDQVFTLSSHARGQARKLDTIMNECCDAEGVDALDLIELIRAIMEAE